MMLNDKSFLLQIYYHDIEINKCFRRRVSLFLRSGITLFEKGTSFMIRCYYYWQ